ncbi:MAG: LysE family transporter [Moraxella sp.]|nr:LysE family transporter [Moraxella sp.]
MFGINEIGVYIVTVITLVLLPGPNSMLIMTMASKHGVRLARFGILGTFLGNGLLIGASALGAGMLLKLYPLLFVIIKLMGAVYLTYLGIKLLRSAAQKYRTNQAVINTAAINTTNKQAHKPCSQQSTSTPTTTMARQPNTDSVDGTANGLNKTGLCTKKGMTALSAFQKALFVALLNPKGLLFFPAMMVQFVEPTFEQPLISFAILGGIFQLMSLIFLNICVPLTSRITGYCQRFWRVSSLGEMGVGVLFLSFAGKLWLSQT